MQGIDGGYRVRDGQFREPGTESWVDSVMRQGLSQGWAGYGGRDRVRGGQGMEEGQIQGGQGTQGTQGQGGL